MNIHTHSYDAVIVGAGGAGLRAAIEVAGKCRTAVITKLYPTRSHTGAAQGGMCAALANVEEDSWEWHTFDTVKGGDYLVDQAAAEIMCREAIDAVIELEHFGLPFNRTPEGRIDQRRFGGHTRNHGEAPVRRACYSADRTGHMILQTLYQQCVARDVNFFNEYQVLDVVFEGEGADRRVAAAVAYELATGDLHVFQTKAILFASGGFGKMFKISSNAHSLTGDGPGLLYRRGIPMEDMEMFQFHPTGIYKMGILLSEAARGEGGILRNCDGERFMERYAPTVKDLAPRDMVSRAELLEIREGRGCGPNKDHIMLDLTHLPPEQIDAKLPDITEFVRTYLGIEPKKDLIPIQPTAHYAMGGIPTNIQGRGRHRRGGHRAARPLRRGGVRVRVGARREPPRHELVARHRGVRPPGRSGDGRVRCDCNDARAPGRRGRRHQGRASSGCSRRRATRTSPTSAKSCRTR